MLTLLMLLWLGATPRISLWLRAGLEAPFPPVAVEAVPKAQAIVVLGGALTPTSAQRPYPDLHDAADRVWHAARLYRAGKAPLVLLSGGADRARSLSSEAEAMGLFLRDLGVPAPAIVLEPDSRNTRENARFSARLLRARGIDHVLLVTSALHMRRALLHFQAEGLTVTAAATDHSPLQADGWGLMPEAIALDGSSRALKEWVGRAIWPTPAP